VRFVDGVSGGRRTRRRDRSRQRGRAHHLPRALAGSSVGRGGLRGARGMITTSSEGRKGGRRSRPIAYGNETRSARNRGIPHRGELLRFHSQEGRKGGRPLGDLAETADAVLA